MKEEPLFTEEIFERIVNKEVVLLKEPEGPMPLRNALANIEAYVMAEEARYKTKLDEVKEKMSGIKSCDMNNADEKQSFADYMSYSSKYILLHQLRYEISEQKRKAYEQLREEDDHV